MLKIGQASYGDEAPQDTVSKKFTDGSTHHPLLFRFHFPVRFVRNLHNDFRLLLVFYLLLPFLGVSA